METELCVLANSNRVDDIGWSRLFHIDFDLLETLRMSKLDLWFIDDGMRVECVITAQTKEQWHFYIYGNQHELTRVLKISTEYWESDLKSEDSIIEFKDVNVYIYFPASNKNK